MTPVLRMFDGMGKPISRFRDEDAAEDAGVGGQSMV